jgi:hypothetical protein
MACEIIKITDSIIHVRIRDVMGAADQKMLESIAVELIEKGKKPRVIAVLENFKGWEKGGAGGDLGFMLEHYDDIVKMAIVGDERWKEEAFLYVGKGLRSTRVEFFSPSSLKQAEEWVSA